jgi:hypothetical protein
VQAAAAGGRWRLAGGQSGCACGSVQAEVGMVGRKKKRKKKYFGNMPFCNFLLLRMYSKRYIFNLHIAFADRPNCVLRFKK